MLYAHGINGHIYLLNLSIYTFSETLWVLVNLYHQRMNIRRRKLLPV